MNFAPAPGRVPVPRIIADVETALSRVSDECVAERARVKVTDLLRRHQKHRTQMVNLTPEECRAIKQLKCRENGLSILPADKGRVTVVMDKDEYDWKLQQMLDDTNTYEKLRSDPAPALEWRMNGKLLALRKKNELPTVVYDKLRSSGGRTPCLYGLPKIHKDGVPLRPIVSFTQSPTYQLSKYLSQLLSPLLGESCTFSSSESK